MRTTGAKSRYSRARTNGNFPAPLSLSLSLAREKYRELRDVECRNDEAECFETFCVDATSQERDRRSSTSSTATISAGKRTRVSSSSLAKLARQDPCHRLSLDIASVGKAADAATDDLISRGRLVVDACPTIPSGKHSAAAARSRRLRRRRHPHRCEFRQKSLDAFSNEIKHPLNTR